MDYVKETDYIYGKMEVNIMVTLNKDIEMVMVFGRIKIKIKFTKDIICSIRNMDMEYIVGVMGIHIKVIMFKINDLDRANCYFKLKQFMMVCGLMDKKQMIFKIEVKRIKVFQQVEVTIQY